MRAGREGKGKAIHDAFRLFDAHHYLPTHFPLVLHARSMPRRKMNGRAIDGEHCMGKIPRAVSEGCLDKTTQAAALNEKDASTQSAPT